MKNVELQENIAEVGENKVKHISVQEKQNDKIVPIVKSLLKRDATFLPHDIITREEECTRLMSYVKHQGKETSKVLVQCKTGEDDNNNAIKIGLLCRIRGFFGSGQNNMYELKVTPIKSVKFSLIDQAQIQDCDHTQIQNLNALGLTLGKVSDIKYRISDFTRLLLLVEEARNLMPKPMLLDFPVGFGDRRIIPDIEYIIRLSEWLIDHIVSRNSFQYLRKQGLQLRTITNLNHRYEEIIHLIKEIIEFKRLDSIREVNSVPLEYAPMIVLEPKQLQEILKRKGCRELRYSHNASVSLSQLRQYQKQGTELILTSVDIKNTNMKNLAIPRAYSVLGKISNIMISRESSSIGIDIVKFIKISDIVYYCGAYYGMPKQHEDYKELDGSELKELKELVEKIGKLFIQQENCCSVIPIYVEGTEGYEKYAEDFSYWVLSWRERDISNDFEQKSTKEKLEYVLSFMTPKALCGFESYEEAIVAYDKAIELKPDDVVAYYNKGKALTNLERYEEALAAFDKAIELDPYYADAHHKKTDALNKLKRYKEAMIECDKALEAAFKRIESIPNKNIVSNAIIPKTGNKDFKVLLEEVPLSLGARNVAQQKIESLKSLQDGSNEKSNVEKYLNYLFRLPWGKFDKASIDIIEAKKILNENHYGLESVKQKIIESLAFMANSQNVKPPILYLVGAPGVGKTLIAKVISTALNRKSVTLSLAGARDEGLIRGCMNFYVGAKPGKALSLLSEVGSSNPVMILDEIDKISKERDSALEGALLQLIDPSQNDSFTDDYFDFGYDMSKVFFIATANSIDNISYPLLHRMEVIDISGYTDNEKVKITQDYIIPKLMKEANVPSNKFTLSDELIRYIIEHYTRESGVKRRRAKNKRATTKISLSRSKKRTN